MHPVFERILFFNFKTTWMMFERDASKGYCGAKDPIFQYQPPKTSLMLLPFVLPLDEPFF